MTEFSKNNKDILRLTEIYELKLLALSEDTIENRRNSQNRNIKQIIGHMVDSASNNTHRIIHLQYQPSPLHYPDYANLGVNDKWISIQNYEGENWYNLVQLWKYSQFHITHVIEKVDGGKLKNVWTSALNVEVTLEEMIIDYPRHFHLHLAELDELMNQQ